MGTGKDLQDQEDALMQRYEEEQMQQMQMQQAQNVSPYASTMFQGQNKQNLVEWQLDFKNELDDIERLLRCDIMVNDTNGNQIWIRNPNPERIIFNDIGVNDILREIRMFLNKNKVLSNYGVEEIKPRIKMIGHEIRILIYNNYEHYGMDNEYKQNNYSMIVLTILSMIEDSYRRAINGLERKDLNSFRTVVQQEPLAQPMPYGTGISSQGKKSILKPWTW